MSEDMQTFQSRKGVAAHLCDATDTSEGSFERGANVQRTANEFNIRLRENASRVVT